MLAFPEANKLGEMNEGRAVPKSLDLVQLEICIRTATEANDRTLYEPGSALFKSAFEKQNTEGDALV